MLIALLIACGQGPGPTGTNPTGATAIEPLPSQTATSVHQLYKLAAEWELGGVEPSEDDDAGVDFTVPLEPLPNPKKLERPMPAYRAKIPFTLSAEDQRFRPEGMSVFIGDDEVPYSRQPITEAAEASWRVKNQWLIVSHNGKPAETTIRWTGIDGALLRHAPEASGLEPAEFVSWELTLAGHTRQGLMLPAPSTGSWDLTLPAGTARFESWVALEATPVKSLRSDGATVVLGITADGEQHEVARIELDPDAKAGFVEMRADLSAWAGKDVTVTISTDPGVSPEYDWVFVGAPTIVGEPSNEVRRVIVIGLDTTRPDHISFNGYPLPTTPELDVIAGQSVVFDRAWAPAPRTRPSFRSATTGRWPLAAVGSKNIGEVFQDEGWATAGIVANIHLQPRFDFHQGYDTWSFDGKADAVDQVDRSLDWLNANLDRDTYLFVHFMDPHLIYNAPGQFRDKFLVEPDPRLEKEGDFNRWDVLQWQKGKKLTPKRKKHIKALHDGEMAYTSQELGRFFAELDKLPGKTLVVVHSDHGEEFWEHDGFEHNHSLYDEVTRAVLWVRPGGGLTEGFRVDTPVSLVDIAPTVFDLAGITDRPDVDGKSLVPLFDPDAQPDESWSRPLAMAHLQYSHERWGVVWNDHKYILHTGSGRAELYDILNDKAERNNIAEETDLTPWVEALAEAHDISVGPGVRVRFNLPKGSKPVTVTMPIDIIEAGVLDPETSTDHRANLEWGETPKRLVEDIGTVEVAEDNRSFVYTPGKEPRGVLYVRTASAPDAAAIQLERDGVAMATTTGPKGKPRWDGAKKEWILFDRGTVLVPPPTEFARMQALRDAGSVAESERAMLEKLGYIH